jgi:hypothetical protein
MNKKKAFAWCPFSRTEDRDEVGQREGTWGAILLQGHLIIGDDMSGWRRLLNANDVTLYILGHGLPNDPKIYSSNGSSKTPDEIFAAIERNLFWMGQRAISKIKVFTCHGGTQDGPAHALKKLLAGRYWETRVFGYTDTTWDPNFPKQGDPSERKYAGGTIQQPDQRRRASSARFEVEPNYGDVSIHIGTIQLQVEETPGNKGWCAC